MHDVFSFRRSIWPAAVTSLIATIAMMKIADIAINNLLPMPAIWHGRTMIAHYDELRAWGWSIFQRGFPNQIPLLLLLHLSERIAASADSVKERFAQVGVLRSMTDAALIHGISIFVTAATAFTCTYYSMQPCDRVRHIRGRRFTSGRRARRHFNKTERRIRKVTGLGLRLAPGMRMARERETRHFLVSGATGSGKTVIIHSLLKQILDRGDKLIAHDTKGDVTETLPADRFTLLGPHDARSGVWDIGSDVKTEQEARELAFAFIPESQEPVWANGAREIMAGVVITLQKNEGQKWGWEDLKNLLFADIASLRRIFAMHYTEGLAYLEFENNGPSRTTISFVVTMRAHLAMVVLPLANAWSRKNPSRRFSARSFIFREDADDRIVVLQRAPHLPSLSTAWIGAIVKLMANYSVGPLLPDDSKRRIWFALDEFPQLGKLDGFAQILEKGRSKGICVIIGAQDISQINEKYGSEVAQGWFSSIGTRVICRTESGASASLICRDWIGKREVSWTDKSKSMAPFKWDGSGGGTTRSKNVQYRTVEVVSDSYLQSDLGRFETWPVPTIRALVLGVGGYVVEASWPILPWMKIRAATVPADWTK